MKLFNDYGSYLKEKYGCKVYRIGLDAGLSCPNRDGTKGTGGCIYCDEYGSRSIYTNPDLDINNQIAERMASLKKMKQAKKFIAYFQAFTNTFAPTEMLKKLYDQVLEFDDVIGMSIGTRPDAVDKEKIALIASYNKIIDVWIEYGLQSIHDRTLKKINRGHTFADFTASFDLAKSAGLPVCAHVILGLPGETKEDMIETAERIASLGIDAVKIHALHVLKETPLEIMYKKGIIKLLEQDEYVDIVCDFIEKLPPHTIIKRLTGQGRESKHMAPAWAMDKIGTINKIKKTLESRGTAQGHKYGS